MRSKMVCFDLDLPQATDPRKLIRDDLMSLEILKLAQPDMFVAHVRLSRVGDTINFEVNNPCEQCGFVPEDCCALDNGPLCYHDTVVLAECDYDGAFLWEDPFPLLQLMWYLDGEASGKACLT